jgi:thiol:disulfide interchange protein DsbC
MQDADVSYMTADGKYFLDGNLYDMQSRENLTEAAAHARAPGDDRAVPESEMLIFSPPNPKYTITVFTDVDCAVLPQAAQRNGGAQSLWACAFATCSFRAPARTPKAGEGRSGVVLSQSQRCVDPRQGRRHAGHEQDSARRRRSQREYALGESIGVRGTPAIVTENGDYIAATWSRAISWISSKSFRWRSADSLISCSVLALNLA